VEGLVSSRFSNDTPARVRGDNPRALYPFRLDPESEQPIHKVRLVWKDPSGERHAVEVLGEGQQYVIAGTHPSGAPYEWRDGREPEADSLPMISYDQVQDFLRDLRALVEQQGGTVVEDSRLGRAGKGKPWHSRMPSRAWTRPSLSKR
jgi:hypothetical protein